MAAKVASLLIDVAADVAQVRKDFGDMSQVVTGFGETVSKVGDLIKTAIGIFSFEQAVEKVRELVQEVGDLGDKAQTMGLAAEDMQAFNVALLAAGVNADKSGQLMSKAARTIGEALEGNKTQIDFFKQLGVGLTDAAGRAAPVADVMQRAAAAILKVEDPARRVADATQLMGRSGGAAVPALKELADGADALRAKYADAIIPDKVIERFHEFTDTVELMKEKAKASAAVTISDFFDANLVAALERTMHDIGAVFDNLKGGFASATTAGDQFALMVDRTNTELEDLSSWLAKGTGWVHDMIHAWTEWGMVGDIVITDLIGKLRSLFGAANAGDFANAVEEKLRALGRFRAGLPSDQGETGGTPDLSVTKTAPRPTGGFNNFPTAKNTGVDKYAEAVKKLQEQLDATREGMEAFAASSDLPTKEAERIAKSVVDVGLELAKFKDIPPAQRDLLRPLIQQLVDAKFAFDDMKQTQQQADTVNAKYGDGTKTLADQVYYLDKAYADNKIKLDVYTQATKDATNAAQLQAEVNKGLGQGLDQMGAGFTYAALQMSQANTSFKQGQQLFTSSFQIMTSAVSDFVTTGQINFGKLAQSFAVMLADMTAKWIASTAIQAMLGPSTPTGFGIPGAAGMDAFLGASGSGASSGGLFSWLGGLFSGMRASGGPVMAGGAYTVGEQGPEYFVPKTAGTIVPMGGSGAVTVNLDMSGSSNAQGATPAQALAFGRKVKAAVADVIQTEKMPGGSLYQRVTA